MQKEELAKEFEQKVKENELLIYKVCSIYTFTKADKQDLFQEIVIQLWQSYSSFKGESKFSTWLYRVAINTAISGIRKRKNFIESHDPSVLPTQIAEQEIDDNTEEKIGQLQIAIRQLNDIEKAIVMLYLEEKTYEEMEEVLGMSQGNLRVKMNRIKEKLRQLTKNN